MRYDRKKAIALSLALTAYIGSADARAQAAPPAPEVVRIGLIDTKVIEQAPEGFSVVSRHFGVPGHAEGVERVNTRKSHGDLVLDAMADARGKMGDGRPYEVMAANPFVDMPNGSLAVNFRGLSQAVQWMKEGGVKVVVTTFAAGARTPGMDAFEKQAREAGMTVVASVGNEGMASVPFPAAYDSSIAIDGYHYRQKGRASEHAPFLKRADAVFDGMMDAFSHPEGVDRRQDREYVSFAPDRKVQVSGSSFAVGRAGAFIASRLGDAATPEAARALVRGATAEPGRPVDLASGREVPVQASPKVNIAAVAAMRAASLGR